MPDTATNARMLHTMIRVHDLDKSLAFYTGPMGMKLLRKRDVPEGKYTLAFVGYGDEKEHCVVELTYNYGHEPYELGSGFGHLAVGVPDVLAAARSRHRTFVFAAYAVGIIAFAALLGPLTDPARHPGSRWDDLLAVSARSRDARR